MGTVQNASAQHTHNYYTAANGRLCEYSVNKITVFDRFARRNGKRAQDPFCRVGSARIKEESRSAKWLRVLPGGRSDRIQRLASLACISSPSRSSFASVRILGGSLRTGAGSPHSQQHKNNGHPTRDARYFGAGSRGRTGTVSLPTDFESVTSANSIIPAFT